MNYNLLITLSTFLGMEVVTWFTHKFVMHGFLWVWHRDHHQPSKDKFFEKNDLFFLIFSLPSISLFIVGQFSENKMCTYIGLGVFLYGIAYFFVHDIIIHQRFKLVIRKPGIYVKAIRKGHKIHHKHLGPEDGECFGMLLVPFKYFKEALNASRN